VAQFGAVAERRLRGGRSPCSAQLEPTSRASMPSWIGGSPTYFDARHKGAVAGAGTRTVVYEDYGFNLREAKILPAASASQPWYKATRIWLP